MLKKLHLKVLLLMATLVFGVGNVWGDEVTYTFSSKSWASSNGNWTSGQDGNALTSGRGVQITKGASGANATSPISFSNISKIVVTYSTNASDGAGAIKFKVGDGTEQSLSVTKTGGTTDRTLTYNFSPAETGNVKITVTCTTNSIYVKSVTITYTAGGGSTVYTPAITPATGTYNNVQSVSMSCETDGATIYYTTDGSEPTTNSNVYSEPFAMTTAGTVKAYAVKDDMTDSSVASATYTYKVADPVFSVAAGTIIAPQDVTINTETVGATIYYTTDGSDPDDTKTAYTDPIHVDGNMTIKAIAIKDGFTNSAVKTVAYTFFAINAKNINSGYFEKVTDDASTLEDGDCILIVNESAGVAMSTTQNENNRGQNDITLTDGTTYAPAAGVQKLILKKVTESGDDYFYFYTGSGFLYAASNSKNYLRTQTTINDNAKASISISSGNATIEFQGSNSHNLIQYNSGSSIFSCYASAQQNIQIYKEVAKNESVTITSTGSGYATYCSEYALDFSGVAGLTAYKAKMNGTTVEFTEVKNVPAETGVLVQGAAATYYVPVVASSDTKVDDNVLVGVTAEKTIGKQTDDNFNYVLKNGSDGVGFYQVNNVNYKVRANSAYLAISYDAASQGAKLFIGLDGETAVEAVAAEVLPTGTAYNLQGQRVGNDYKGVVIVNGKKVIR